MDSAWNEEEEEVGVEEGRVEGRRRDGTEEEERAKSPTVLGEWKEREGGRAANG